MIEKIASRNTPLVRDSSDARSAIIFKALALLLDIHYRLEEAEDAALKDEVLYNSANRRIVDALLDLISLEGIYPNLLPGVGVPIQRRVKSVLRNGTVSRGADINGELDQDRGLLVNIAVELDRLALSNGKGLYNAFIERTLVDLIAARGQLAYGSDINFPDQFHITALQLVLDEYVCPIHSLFTFLIVAVSFL